MTYQTQDVGVALVGSAIQNGQRDADAFPKFFQGRQNALVFQGSWAEQYVEGCVGVVLKFEPSTRSDLYETGWSLWAVVGYESDAGNPQKLVSAGVVGREGIDPERLPSGKQNGMFIHNVEPVEFVEG